MRHPFYVLMISFMTLFGYSLNFTCVATTLSQTDYDKNHDEDAAMIYQYIAAADKTKILGVLLDEFCVEEISNIHGRISLARYPNGRGQEYYRLSDKFRTFAMSYFCSFPPKFTFPRCSEEFLFPLAKIQNFYHIINQLVINL